jgi:hypothetical protein
VGKPWSRFDCIVIPIQDAKRDLERDPSESQHDAQARQTSELRFEVGQAGVNLLRGWFVVRWRYGPRP